LRGPGAALHGEHVAIGVLITSVLQQNPDGDRVRRLFDRIGLTAALRALEVDESTLVKAVQLAPSTRPGRRTVLDGVDLSTPSVAAVVAAALQGDGR
jgi:glycerol dehydrogenase-like iron-containing ADH family enzyme